MRNLTVPLALALLLSTSLARATPSSIVWANSVDAQAFGTAHLGIDNFVAMKSQASPLSADVGLTFGLSPLESFQLEVGADWWTNSAAPLWLNAKAVVPEAGARPAFALGAYGVGFEEGSAYHVVYVLVAKSFGAVGRLSLGGYHALGDPALFGESARLSPSSLRTGVIAAWERTMTEVSDRLWMAVDVQTGLNAFSAASVGVAWKLAPSASVMLGYNHMLDRANYPSTLYLALDADLDLRSPGGS